ncbi:MAG: hypothetical protein ABFS23_09355 [Pseudomonadota bacterium]
MKKTSGRYWAGLAAGLLWVQCANAEYPIAGVAPDQRPAGAPVIAQFQKSSEWYAHALHGVSRPYPWSFRFLEDQGAWHTPFNNPGMHGPYDLRGWHATGSTGR